MRVRIAAAVVVWVSLFGAAAAEEAAPPPEPAPAAAAPAPAAGPTVDLRRGHKGQFGASARFSVGMRGIATYDDVDYCGDRSMDTGTGNAAVCVGRAPFALDLELSYGLAARIEGLLEIRLGLERDFGATVGMDGPRQLFLSPGVRFFFSDAKTTKLFTTLQLVVDVTGYDDASGQGRGTDLGFRNLSGLWFDLHPAYGFYVYISETLTFQRWLAGELALGVGFQGRYP